MLASYHDPDVEHHTPSGVFVSTRPRPLTGRTSEGVFLRLPPARSTRGSLSLAASLVSDVLTEQDCRGTPSRFVRGIEGLVGACRSSFKWSLSGKTTPKLLQIAP